MFILLIVFVPERKKFFWYYTLFFSVSLPLQLRSPLELNRLYTKVITVITTNHCHSPTTDSAHRQARCFEVNVFIELVSQRCPHTKLRYQPRCQLPQQCNSFHITKRKIVHFHSVEQLKPGWPATGELRTSTVCVAVIVNQVAEFRPCHQSPCSVTGA